MHRIPSSPPVILPLTSHAENRPLWSVMIPAYNCAQYLPETLESVLRQAPPEEDMQIEVIDDASTDADVEALVKSIGKGRVKYFRQAENRGSLRNFETCLNRSRGRLIHLLHGDDTVYPGYYEKITALFRQYPDAGAAFCRFSYLDEHGRKIQDQKPEMKNDGILPDWLPRIAVSNLIQYAAITVRREVYENVGSFFGITFGEDWEMWVRIARYYPVAYTPEILAAYRMHTRSISSHKFLTGQYLQDLARAMDFIQAHVPPEKKESVLKRARKHYASYGVKLTGQLWDQSRSRVNVQANLQQALRMHRSLYLYGCIARVYTKMFLQELRAKTTRTQE